MCKQYVIMNDKGQYQYLELATIRWVDHMSQEFIANWSNNFKDAEVYSDYGEAKEAAREHGGKVINVCDINA